MEKREQEAVQVDVEEACRCMTASNISNSISLSIFYLFPFAFAPELPNIPGLITCLPMNNYEY